MSTVNKTSQKKRPHKVSKGLNKHSKHPLSAVEKVLTGKGLMQSIKHVECLRPWRGVGVVTTPWNAKNVAENRRDYPHLFPED